MKHYIYINHSDYPNDKVVFECDAEGILEADKKYQTTTDENVEKQSHVGCQIKLNSTA